MTIENSNHAHESVIVTYSQKSKKIKDRDLANEPLTVSVRGGGGNEERVRNGGGSIDGDGDRSEIWDLWFDGGESGESGGGETMRGRERRGGKF